MIELTIKGNNYKEIKKQIFELANDIATDSDDDIQIQPASVRPTLPVNESTGVVPSFVVPPTQPMNEVPAPARKRRSKAEIEADKAAKLQAAQAEVQQAQASHAPVAPAITIPQVPTTNHVVTIPQATPEPAPVQQAQPAVVQQPVQPAPVQAPAGAYTLETFKANLVMILNSLLSTGKLNSAWISDTSQKVFGGADIWLWSHNQEKIAELFGMFVEWGFIQEFKG